MVGGYRSGDLVMVSRVTAEIQAVRQLILAEIIKTDRTAVSLMRDGFTRSNVQLGMPVLIKEGKVFKYGAGQNTYYSVNPPSVPRALRKLDPIIIPEAYNSFELAFRMGYTDIVPAVGRVFKGAMNI